MFKPLTIRGLHSDLDQRTRQETWTRGLDRNLDQRTRQETWTRELDKDSGLED